MKIANPDTSETRDEIELLLTELPLRGARIVELGCGKAEKTRALAQSGLPAEMIAIEIDEIQHALNRQVGDLPTVRFVHGGAQAIPADDVSADIVMMFKSLHHVPVDQMDRALREIERVLKPGGLAWISEPVYAGPMNDIMRLFHDEKTVREAAFAALCRAVEGQRFRLEKQIFFHATVRFKDFAEFDARMIRVTHTNHQLTPACHQQVRQAFEAHLADAGASFTTPQRVDLLRKPA